MKKLFYLAFILGIAYSLSSCKYKVIDPLPGTFAGFTIDVDPDTCPAPCVVQFTSTSQNATQLKWTFGDPTSGPDNSSTLEMPEHLFDSDGSYTIRLIATGTSGSDTTTQTLNLREWICGDKFLDPRDFRRYTTTWIDNEGGHNLNKPGSCWMAENLQFEASSAFWSCYDNQRTNCNTYGLLYSNFILDNVCPAGWAIPTVNQWGDLFETYGLNRVLTGNGPLYNGSTQAFLSNGSSQLEVLFGGYYDTQDDAFFELDNSASLWSAEQSTVTIGDKSASVLNFGFQNRVHYSIRCIKN